MLHRYITFKGNAAPPPPQLCILFMTNAAVQGNFPGKTPSPPKQQEQQTNYAIETLHY